MEIYLKLFVELHTLGVVTLFLRVDDQLIDFIIS